MYLKTRYLTACVLIIMCGVNEMNAQNTGPINPVRLDSLVATRLKMPVPSRVSGNYMIQLFYGDKVAAERIKQEYDAKELQWESVMRYEQPFHKVWIGKFKNKSEGERVLNELRKEYPKAFVFLPKS